MARRGGLASRSPAIETERERQVLEVIDRGLRGNFADLRSRRWVKRSARSPRATASRRVLRRALHSAHRNDATPGRTPGRVAGARNGVFTAYVQREQIAELPLYPEQRRSKRPTTEQVLRLFSLVERHVLLDDDQPVQVFEAELTDLQRQVLDLLRVPERAFRLPT